MRKIVLSGLSLIVALGIVVGVGATKAHAVNLTITCDLSDCDHGPLNCSLAPASGAALFEEANFLPGHSVQRTLTAVNTGCSCNSLILTFPRWSSSPSGFIDKLFTVIKEGGTDAYGVRNGNNKASGSRTLANAFSDGSINLGALDSGVTRNFNWVVTFDPAADNTYQNAETRFDFKINASCGAEDGNDGDDGDDEDDGDGNDGGDSTDEDTSGGSGFLFNILTPLAGEVAGTTTTETTQSTQGEVAGTTTLPEVKGTGTCIDPWWWWLVFVLQVLISLVVYILIKDKHYPIRKRFYFIQAVNMAVFLFIFWKYFCPWWDIWVSGGISVVWLILTYKKFRDMPPIVKGEVSS